MTVTPKDAEAMPPVRVMLGTKPMDATLLWVSHTKDRARVRWDKTGGMYTVKASACELMEPAKP